VPSSNGRTDRFGREACAVKEESQLEEMRAAVRGDRERAERARERSQESVRALVEPTTPVAEPPQPSRPRGFRGLFRRR
jgi:hypothetical protein